MKTLDERLRRRANTEDCPIPDGFDGRLAERVAGLPERAVVRRPKLLRRALIAAAAVVALCVAGVAASPVLLQMAADAAHYFEIPAGFRALAGKVAYQPYSSAVGASVTDRGYTLTVDGIAVDDAFITLYCTVTGEEPIPLREDGSPKVWPLHLKADGAFLEFWGYDQEVELADANTLRIIQRCPVLRVLPDVVELEVYADELFYGLSGQWHLALAVDKSAPAEESLVAQPNLTFTVDGEKITVEKVVVAPSGGGLVLSQAGRVPPLERFVLRDDRGNPLPTKRYGTVGSPILPISNFISFTGGRADMAYITLIPTEDADGKNHVVTGALDGLPLTDACGENGYTLLTLEVGEKEAVAVFAAKGALGESDNYIPDFWLLDGAGERADLGDCTLERDRDGETRLWTVTLSYPEAGAEALQTIAGVSFWQPNGYTLLEEQAVTIPLG